MYLRNHSWKLRSNYYLANTYLGFEVTKQRALYFMRQYFYHPLLAPRAKNAATRRREFSLHILLLGITLCAATGILAIIPLVSAASSTLIRQVIAALLLFGSYFLALKLSRKGFTDRLASLLVASSYLLALALLYRLGFEHPTVQLLIVSSILLTSVLFGSKKVLFASFTAATIVLASGQLQTKGYYIDGRYWHSHPPTFINALASAIVYVTIGLIIWLTSREAEQTLDRAQQSEQALSDERDALERTVIERTKLLKQTNLARVQELERFAELGKLSAGILHEFTTPLAAATMSLEQASKSSRSSSIATAQQSLERIEQYLTAIRRQFKQPAGATFRPNRELKDIISICQPIAQQHQVALKLETHDNENILGDATKFSQLIINLVTNAIEAFPEATLYNTEQDRIVRVATRHQGKGQLVISVEDTGIGLSPDQLQTIFEPFVSSKAADGTNMGLGLTLVKRYVEHDFMGTLKVSSVKGKGTCFKVYLPIARLH